MAGRFCNRRDFLAHGAFGLAGLAVSGTVLGDTSPPRPPDGSQAKDMITPAAQRAIEQGLEFLSRKQHTDGSFGERQYTGNIAITSLAALALMSGGHQPGRGTYGKSVTDALQFVLAKEDRNEPGFFHNPLAATHGPMYEH